LERNIYCARYAYHERWNGRFSTYNCNPSKQFGLAGICSRITIKNNISLFIVSRVNCATLRLCCPYHNNRYKTSWTLPSSSYMYTKENNNSNYYHSVGFIVNVLNARTNIAKRIKGKFQVINTPFTIKYPRVLYVLSKCPCVYGVLERLSVYLKRGTYSLWNSSPTPKVHTYVIYTNVYISVSNIYINRPTNKRALLIRLYRIK